MIQKFTKNKKLSITAMLLIFCALTNNIMAWEGNGTPSNPWKIGDSQTNTTTAVTAVLSENTLTISGSGNMADFWHSTEGEAPWWFNTTQRNAIQTVFIQSGVTNIGDRAFKDCSNLTWITISSSCTIIGQQAFYSCTSLQAVLIPENVSIIENEAFRNCTALTTIYNQAITPQTISNNVFQSVTMGTIYLAVPFDALKTYQSKSVWNNCHITPPSFRCSENLGGDVNEIIKGLDGSITYLKYWNNNASLPKQIIMYDGISEEPQCVINFNPDGKPERYVIADGTTIFTDGYGENIFNVGITTPNGTHYSINDLFLDIAEITKGSTTADKTLSSAQKVLKEILLDVSIQSWDEFKAPSWFGIAEKLMETRAAEAFLPDNIKAGFSMISFVVHEDGMVASCSTFVNALPLWGLGPVGWIPVIGLGANCAIHIKETWDASKNLPDSWKDVFGQNDKSNCSVTVKLTGGTLVIAGNGALCTEEIKYADRKNEIKKLVINSGVTSIPNKAFANYPNLKTVTISAGGTSPLDFSYYYSYDKCFSGSPIETLVLNRNISYRSSGNAPFSENTYLKNVTIGNDVTSIGSQCFYNCTGLQTVNLANSKITSIGSNAFANDSSITTHLNFPNTLTTIGDNAFYACGLPEVTIPNSVTTIGNKVFQNCKNLKTVTISAGGTSPLDFSYYYSYDKCFSGSPIETLVLNRNISYRSSGNAPFSENTYLKSITIGNDVTSISTSSFSGCTGLSQITSNTTTPPTLDSNAFYNVSKSIPVYINCNYLSAYQSAQYWSGFTNYQCAVQVVPAFNSAAVIFPKIDNATTYKLSIYNDENQTNRVTEINLDANGKLKSASEQNDFQAETTFSCSVSGLLANTCYYYSLTPYSASGNMLTVFTGDFTTTAGSGIENIVASQMSIYPNPAKDDIFIKSELKIETVEIYSLAGSLLILENDFNEKISVSTLPKAIYLLKAYTDKGLIVRKFVKD